MKGTRQALLDSGTQKYSLITLSCSASVTAEVLLLRDTHVSPLRTRQLLPFSVHRGTRVHRERVSLLWVYVKASRKVGKSSQKPLPLEGFIFLS